MEVNVDENTDLSIVQIAEDMIKLSNKWKKKFASYMNAPQNSLGKENISPPIVSTAGGFYKQHISRTKTRKSKVRKY